MVDVIFSATSSGRMSTTFFYFGDLIYDLFAVYAEISGVNHGGRPFYVDPRNIRAP